MNMRVVILAVVLGGLSCDTMEPPPPPPSPPEPVPTITLSIEDISLTEVWLGVAIADTIPSRNFSLFRDNQIVLSGELTTTDTLVRDVGLFPGRTYVYRAYRLSDSVVVDSSAALPVATMDTTSNIYTWTIDTLGDATSLLRDVAIISEDEIWAVGSLFLKDSLGQLDPVQYNLAKWNGQEWNYERVLFPICDSSGREIGNGAPFACYSVFAFATNDVWLMDLGGFVHWNGSSYLRICIPPFGFVKGGLRKLWGNSGSNLFAVGGNGSIIHYDGTSWQAMESGTTVDLLDVWGNPDGSTVWACGYESSFSESVLLRYNGSVWEDYGHSPPRGVYQDLFGSVWFPRSDSAFVIGDRGIFKHAQGIPQGYRMLPVDLSDLPYRIRGMDRNDATLVGNNGMVWHFNGLTWHNFSELFQPLDLLLSVSASSTQVVAVGQRYYAGIEYYGVVYRGTK